MALLNYDVLTNTEMFGQNLTQAGGLEAKTVKFLKMIRSEGALAAMNSVL